MLSDLRAALLATNDWAEVDHELQRGLPRPWKGVRGNYCAPNVIVRYVNPAARWGGIRYARIPDGGPGNPLMKLSDERLGEILDQLQRGQPATTATREEWLSITLELNQLRLRTSSQSRSAAAAKTLPGSH